MVNRPGQDYAWFPSRSVAEYRTACELNTPLNIDHFCWILVSQDACGLNDIAISGVTSMARIAGQSHNITVIDVDGQRVVFFNSAARGLMEQICGATGMVYAHLHSSGLVRRIAH